MKNEDKSKKSKHTSAPIPKHQRELFINLTIDLYLKGWSYRKISAEIELQYGKRISIVTVGNYINKALDEWKSERVEKLDDLKTVELQRINKLENTYWEAWERSLEGSKRSSEKQRAMPGGGKAVTEKGDLADQMKVVVAEKATSTEDTFGDPRFLNGIQWCISIRCKILGIEAPIEFRGSISNEIKRTTVFKTRVRKRPQ